MAINHFRDGFAFLSNFYPSQITYDGEVYATVEHAYQAAKTLNPDERKKVRDCRTPGQAKRMGRKVTLRQDWETIKIDVMGWLVREKFRDPELIKELLETGDHELIEGNTWGDKTWGQVDGVGHNYLGRILMAIRTDLKGRD